MSVYMHVNVCTMIEQNDNAQGGAQNPQRGGGGVGGAMSLPPLLKKTPLY